jgi:predicted nucleotidyltransferase
LANPPAPTPVRLHESTRDPAVDALLIAVLQAFGRAFPGRVEICYLIGSYADATGVPTSDIDLTLVFADRWRPGESLRAAALLAQVAAASSLELDGSLVEGAILAEGVAPALKWAARGAIRARARYHAHVQAVLCARSDDNPTQEVAP